MLAVYVCQDEVVVSVVYEDLVLIVHAQHRQLRDAIQTIANLHDVRLQWRGLIRSLVGFGENRRNVFMLVEEEHVIVV